MQSHNQAPGRAAHPQIGVVRLFMCRRAFLKEERLAANMQPAIAKVVAQLLPANVIRMSYIFIDR
jgi:hypothetical protein